MQGKPINTSDDFQNQKISKNRETAPLSGRKGKVFNQLLNSYSAAFILSHNLIK